MSDFAQRAQTVQDRIGWSDARELYEMSDGLLELARLVTDMARALDAQVSHVHLPQAPPEPIECCASGSCEVCGR